MPDTQLIQTPPPEAARLIARLIAPVLAVLIVIFLVSNSYYTVPQTDVAFVTRFGKVLSPEAGPIGPGLHFKAPFIDVADRLRTTTDTFELPERKAYTRDTQEVTLDMGVTYRVPPTAAYHLMYEIGQAGNVDIHSNVVKLSAEVVREVLSKHSANEIAGVDREKVVGEIKTGLANQLDSLLKLEIAAVQLNSLEFSPQYREAINQATLAQTKSVAAQQDAARARIEAETRVTQAKAEADARAAQAALTPAQLALGWVLAQRPFTVPIPGTTSVSHLAENIAAAERPLAADLVAAVDRLFPAGALKGARYPAAMQAQIDTELLPHEDLAA
eukprot:gene23290-24690_t